MNVAAVPCNMEDLFTFIAMPLPYAHLPNSFCPSPTITTQAWFRARKGWVFHLTQAAGAPSVSGLPKEGLPQTLPQVTPLREGLPQALRDLAALVCRLAIEPCPDHVSQVALHVGGKGASSLVELLQCCGDTRPDALECFMRLHWEQSPLHLRPSPSPFPSGAVGD